MAGEAEMGRHNGKATSFIASLLALFVTFFPFFFFTCQFFRMKSCSCRIVSTFVLQLSAVFAAAIGGPSHYYGHINSKTKHSKHESEGFVLGVAFENFREIEVKYLEEEVREVLSQIVPVALTAAIQKDDP